MNDNERLLADNFFARLDGFFEAIPDYGLKVLSITSFGDELVGVHVDSWGTGIQPGGGLLVYRVEGGQIVQCWVVSKGDDATAPF